MKRSEVAAALGMSEADVAEIEVRALAKLRAQLEPPGPSSGQPPRRIEVTTIRDACRAAVASRGICTYCRKERARDGMRMCLACSVRAAAATKLSRQRRRAAAASRR